ncbi:MAG: ATP-binding response regulator, partial [Planctomycetaceae bacterium]
SRITQKRITLRKQPLDLGPLVAHAVRSVQSIVDDYGHELHLDLPEGLLLLEGDQTRLEQVVVNLLNNAVKYTEPGGQIWLQLERQGDLGVLQVRDSGIGIAAEMLPRIFEPFVQAEGSLERARGGLGIGLTLVQKLVELHGGSVHADSEGEGCGSTFTVRLPLLSATRTRPEDAAAPRLTIPGRRILLVEDTSAVARMTNLLLHKCGHQVVAVASDGPSAIDAACQHVPEVVLLDIGLPGMNGYDVAKQLRRIPELEHVMLVAMTGYGQEEDRRRSREAGFDHHLVKPVSVQTLQDLFARPAANGQDKVEEVALAASPVPKA